jgi:tRNA/rRNA methyltransferase
LHIAAPAPLARVSVVLVNPSHAGNIGAAARAMRVMGLRSLALVAPRHPQAASHPDAIAFASGATDVLAAAREFPTLEAALADTHLAVAVSAATREFAAAPIPPWALGPRVLAALAADAGLRVALVFGNERTGLSIAQVQRCAMVVSIPGEPDYHSLNLAQAVQVLAWELRRAALGVSGVQPAPAGEAAATSAGATEPALAEPDAGPPATHEQLERFHAHFEQALIAVGFLDPATPRKLMPRMRRLFARAALRAEEVDLLRGVCKQMLLAAEGRLPGRRPPAEP